MRQSVIVTLAIPNNAVSQYPRSTVIGNLRQNCLQIVEMFGLCRVTVSKELKIQMIEAFFDPETFLQALEGEAGKLEMCRDGKALLGEHSGCPAVNWMKK